MLEQLAQVGLKEGIFALLFIWLLVDTKRESKEREDKLYNFLDGMKEEFSKLVHNYESLSSDVEDIKNDIKFKQQKGE
ncbi:BhlA/UviB family holin-like peptide [Bacillus thuringiensis]|uniref:BhlA/UviB family holin-like peptide n=1 Tax=Bacillus cereus group TaxID=86661 RepID=UPI000CD8C3E4|nr:MULTISPECIES: BhlA/UviB family holin-like peptide [Bacillus cereus group]MEC3417064.1 BhlA/UviB family holin-like peptide [Bacillus cereus]MEC3596968.1 BhlA/UviB family holin-like peptide [Bacillus thuringiensis]MED1573518.1 BhlA/UviB family holin-like peptide [Bacillus paranthracis]MED1836156.1 BhlA/UviB family holin-like peptide [Bacillus thuringiensis]MED2670219.1 BhlA/UviB family holin-like peptide [Bacillus thuringiensis]